MTSMTASTSRRATGTPATALSFGGIIRSEWIKLFSLRSTWWSYALILTTSLAFSALMASTFTGSGGPMPAVMQTDIVIQASTFGVFIGQLILATLGVLVISGEYSTGMIRSSLTAVPRRTPVLVAKGLVLFVTAFVLGIMAALGSFAVASPFLAAEGVSANLSDANVILPLLGSGLYLGLVALFALGIGTIVRSAAGGITATIGLILLLPIMLMLLPISWLQDLQPYLFMNAGLASFGLNGIGGVALGTWPSLLVVFCWTAVALVAGSVILKRRDA